MTLSKTTRNAFFLYSRKSTEAEDRQVLSIDSQIDEVKTLAERLGLQITKVFSEARSAKAPGRPVFNDMMRRISAGEAAGILCWKLDRLARNPIDGGALIWAVRQHGVRIVTPTQTYSHEDDNIILMYIEFGMAHKYIDDLSRVVKRGLEARAKRGWYPTVAPLGYLNRGNPQTSLKDIVTDPERFPLIRRMWELMLTGSYSAQRIRIIANDTWGFRTRAKRALSRSEIYYLFSNPFYTGSFEYPLRSGRWYKGGHEPMITENEFDQVQALLGSRGRPRHIHRTFAYTGLIRCGACNAMVTAEEKHQLICGLCRFKFAHRGRDRCPRCETSIEQMLDGERVGKPTVLYYVYYHCTWRKDPDCAERAIRVEDLEGDLAAYVEQMEVSERFQRWVISQLRRSHEQEVENRNLILATHEKAYRACLARLDSLIQLKTAPENADGHLLSNEEYARQRALLLQEKSRLEALRQDTGERIAQGISLVEEVFEFTRQARTWLREQDLETKRLILAVFAMDGSNLSLAAKRLTIDAPKPFPILAESIPGLPAARPWFEPTKNAVNTRQQPAFAGRSPRGLGRLDDVRTYGEAGLRLVQELQRWLLITSPTELLALKVKLRALFLNVKAARRAA